MSKSGQEREMNVLCKSLYRSSVLDSWHWGCVAESSAELGQKVAANNLQCLLTASSAVSERKTLTVKYIKSTFKYCSLLHTGSSLFGEKNDKNLTNKLAKDLVVNGSAWFGTMLDHRRCRVICSKDYRNYIKIKVWRTVLLAVYHKISRWFQVY